MADQKYLQKHRNSWYVVVEAPKHLRSVLGKPRFLRSLRTDSLSQAQERKHRYVAEFKALIAEAERTKVDPGHRLMFRARELRTELERADDTPVLGPEGKPVPRSEFVKVLIIDEASQIRDFDGELKADQFYAGLWATTTSFAMRSIAGPESATDAPRERSFKGALSSMISCIGQDRARPFG